MTNKTQVAYMTSIHDLARYHGITETDLCRLIDRGEVPVIPSIHGTLIHETDWEAFLTRHNLDAGAVRRTVAKLVSTHR